MQAAGDGVHEDGSTLAVNQSILEWDAEGWSQMLVSEFESL